MEPQAEIISLYQSEAFLALREELIHPTRIHLLENYISTDVKVYLKRDDELSASMIGSKRRKMIGILAFIQLQKIEKVIVEGSYSSNFVMALSQIVNEKRCCELFYLLKKPLSDTSTQNIRLIDWFLTKDNHVLLDSLLWKNRAEVAKDIIAHQPNTLYLPEGGSHFSALSGGLTLADEIIHPIKDLGISAIFIDAGSGMTAIALLLGLYLKKDSQTSLDIYITLIAGKEADFVNQLTHFTGLNPSDLLDKSITIHFHKPPFAKQYGLINEQILSAQKTIAHQTGVICDAVYTVKHLMTVKHYLENNTLQGNALVIHCGGGVSFV